jgi:hypothetical protein
MSMSERSESEYAKIILKLLAIQAKLPSLRFHKKTDFKILPVETILKSIEEKAKEMTIQQIYWRAEEALVSKDDVHFLHHHSSCSIKDYITIWWLLFGVNLKKLKIFSFILVPLYVRFYHSSEIELCHIKLITASMPELRLLFTELKELLHPFGFKVYLKGSYYFRGRALFISLRACQQNH